MKPSTSASMYRTHGTLPMPAHGDYLCSDSDLYCVEQVGREWVVLEDCRTGTLLDLPMADMAKLRPVTPASCQA